jgi:hypothetical protein
MKTFGIVWLLAVAVLVAPRPAEAESVRGVFAIKSDLDGADLVAVTNAASARMQSAGWTVSDQLDKKETHGLLECLEKEGQCFPKQLHARGIRGAIVFQADREASPNGNHVVVLVGKIVLSDRPEFVVLARRCDSCNDDTLAKTSSSLADALLQQLAVQVGRTLVSIRSNPQGADVLLDSKLVGATPVVTKTFPGKHVLQIQKAGYRAADRTVDATEGTTQEVSVELDIDLATGKPRGDASRAGSERGTPWGPIGMIAGGGLLVIGGGALLYVGQLDGRGDPYRYPRATTAGIMTGAVGLGLAAVGGWLWWRDSKKTRGPTVDASPTGAVVGWGGTF